MSKTFLISRLAEYFQESKDHCFEIQLVDDFGHTLDSAVIGRTDTTVLLSGEVVPEEVIRAAQGIEVGETQYVDIGGNPTYPGRNMSAQARKDVFFIRHLSQGEGLASRQEGRALQIDLVNQYGQSIATGYVEAHDETLVINGTEIPSEVIQAVKSLEIGRCYYVNRNGLEVGPGGF